MDTPNIYDRLYLTEKKIKYLIKENSSITCKWRGTIYLSYMTQLDGVTSFLVEQLIYYLNSPANLFKNPPT